MVGWHHRVDGHEFEESLGVGEGQGSLVCCSPWGHKESDMTWQLKKQTKSPLSVWFSLCYLQLIFSLAVLLGMAEA